MEETEKAIILYPYGAGALALMVITGFVICLIAGFIIGWLVK